MGGYVQPKDAVEAACVEWRNLDDEGNGLDGQIDLAASEWMAYAEAWFSANPRAAS